ncbi:MAG: DUF1538 domain-containing protein [Treponema sp.]|jgi:hypothetical protein|nr:DUF1538 domain-containing protein [Treponema sp.]
MNEILKEKIMEAFSSVLPITAIVLIASVVLTPMPSGTILMFLVGAALLIIGMGFFTLGADMAMMPMGEGIGVELTKSSKLLLIILVTLVIGFIISVAEPDLQVLGRQTPSIPASILIITVSVGVGVFLMLSVLRPLLKIRLSSMLIFFYIVTFIVAFFAPDTFVPVGFDSGGVTTGPITVPFILAMGAGIAAIRSDKSSQEDSFGLVAMCSIGPILAVLLLGIFYKPTEIELETATVYDAANSRDVVKYFAIELPHFLEDVLIALGAIVICFVIFQFFTRRYKKHQLGRIVVGFLYTLIGLVIFLTGVNVGFFPVGQLLGSQLASSPFKWILIPLGTLVGYFIVAAEPAVHVLNKQVEEISSGAITVKMMNRGLSMGMALALTITMIRILFSIPIMYILIPGYIFALMLTFFVPPIFTGIAFDSGGVCSGPMTSTFLLPFAMGACNGVGGNLMIDAFGVVAIVAMTPLIVIQLMGLVYQFRTKHVAVLTMQQTAAISAAASKNINWGKIHVYGEEASSR